MAKLKSKLVASKGTKSKKVIKEKAKLVKKKNIKVKSKLDYGSMSVDDFMSTALTTNEDNSESEQEEESKVTKLNGHSKSDANDSTSSLWGEDEDLDQGNTNEFDNEIESHKASLGKLEEIDPEFFKFLQENDKKLLQFNVSDSEDDGEQEEEKEQLEKVHKPQTDDIEVASDESDYEDETGSSKVDSRVVTLKMLKTWQSALQTDKTVETIRCVIEAFHAAMLRVANDEDESFKYKVDGSSIFNAVIQLCVLELSPAIRRYLDAKSSKFQPHKCKKFVKIKSLLQGYFNDLLKLLSGVSSTSILTVLLKHLHHMSVLLISFPHVSKLLLKKLIYLWGSGDEVIRVLAFLCILRITNSQLATLLDTVLKSMYMTYIINSKFVSVNTISSINFMRRSLVEMFALDPVVSYKHVFLYIRQLAIHLRNAIVVKKKENVQTVYNWQFVNSLKLWGSLLSATYGKPQLQPLIYPFVQVSLGTLKLVPTSEYYPLRFHLVKILIDLSKDTGVFIPILPFILEVLNDFDFNKKHKKASMKPLNFLCLLRLSDSQRSESGFKDSTIDLIYGTLLEYLASQSNSIAFPDLSLFCIFQLKQFTKKCTIANYTRKMKQIVDKIKENNSFIELERKNATFTLTDYDKIKIWETIVFNKGTPLNKFYESWNKVNTIKRNKQATNNEALGNYRLPVLKKLKKSNQKADTGPANPFPSDSEEDDVKLEIEKNEDEEEVKVKQEEVKQQIRKRKHKKADKVKHIVKQDIDDGGLEDVVEDLNIDDF